MPDPAAFAAVSLSLSQTVGAYSTFMPRLADVRKAAVSDPGMRGDVRMGQLAAGALSLGVAATMTAISGSTMPLWTTALSALIIMFVYETALRGENLFEGIP